MKTIYYTKPSITELEEQYVCDAIKNGWGSSCYDYIYKFQDSFKEYLGVNHAIATSSCTGALHIALATLEIKAGDEVIVPDSTWIASVSPVMYRCATPVFVDVKEDTWCIDPQKIKEAITSKTKAIICVHLYGNLCEMDEIMAIAKEHNLYVIEDAAEALGSEYKGKKAGAIGDFGVFSFHGTKTLTTGEGGMLVCNDQNLYEKAAVLHDHGRDKKVQKMFWASDIGYKYKISNIQAALGYAQMQRLEELLAKKITIFKLYQKELADIEGIALNFTQEYAKNSYWMPTIVFDQSWAIDRDSLIEYFQKNNIDARVFFYPISSLDMFENVDNEVAYKLSKDGINLPSYFDMTEGTIKYVVKILKDFMGEIKK